MVTEPGGVEALIDQVGTETDPAVRQSVLTALAGLDRYDVAKAMVRYLRSDDAGLRNAALEAVAAMPAAAAALVPELIVDGDADLRILACNLLEGCSDPQADQLVRQLLTDDDHPNVVSAALGALLSFAGPQHRQLLLSVRERFAGEPFIVFTIDAALPALVGP